MPRTWSGVIARMGTPTGDGRILDPAGAASRALPLPLSFQERTEEGHGGSIVVGRIESVRFADGMVFATGSMLDSAEWSSGVIEQLEAGVIGPSVDLDDIEYVMDEDERIVLTQWRVAGATLVSVPAFADVSLTLDPLPVEPATVQSVPVEVLEEYADWDAYSSSLAAFTSTATERPVEVLPPLEWMIAPTFTGLTPLTVTSEGRVFGHIAPWGECHVGLPGCVTAPSSISSYAYFHVGEQMTREGVALPVGTLVAGPPHADPQMAFRAAQSHYDDPAAAVARVTAGEDDFGIWVAGWLLPSARPEAVEVFRSSPVSGDWRRIGGSLELIAVCSVNAPGFPVPRARVAFSGGAQRTFIGSFGVRPVEGENLFPGSGNKSARARWAWASTAQEV